MCLTYKLPIIIGRITICDKDFFVGIKRFLWSRNTLISPYFDTCYNFKKIDIGLKTLKKLTSQPICFCLDIQDRKRLHKSKFLENKFSNLGYHLYPLYKARSEFTSYIEVNKVKLLCLFKKEDFQIADNDSLIVKSFILPNPDFMERVISELKLKTSDNFLSLYKELFNKSRQAVFLQSNQIAAK